MTKPDRQTTPTPAWNGRIAPARFRPVLARGRAPAGKAVGAFVPALTRKAFERFGFSTVSLVVEWPRIAGADLAQWTRPERVKWPQGPATTEFADDGATRPAATLVLRVDPARALDVEYRARQLVERINSYFGYRAIEALRILQAPIIDPVATTAPARAAMAAPAAASGPGSSRMSAVAGGDCDERLARALARLEAGVKASATRG